MTRFTSLGLRHGAGLLAAGVLALVAACGGGGTDAPDADPGTTATAFSQGTISGFGSVIVNGVRWDDSDARISDDDDNRRSSSDLKLGMVVEIEGGSVDRTRNSGRALHIHYGSEMVGPVSDVDAVAGTLLLLGQAVQVTASTVFDSGIAGGLAGIADGDVVEVYGLFDAANQRTVATRIELKTGATEYRLRGTVSALDTTARRFSLGSERIAYGNVEEVPVGLADGLAVKVRLGTVQVDGAWPATRLRAQQRLHDDRSEAEIEGVITAWTSATAFEIDGLPVDASAAVFREGQGGVVLGARVEVEGAIVAGVLVATKVHLEDEDDDDSSREFELHGTLSGLDPAAQTFVLRGMTVSYAGNVDYDDDGNASMLRDGARVEVKGVLSVDMTRIEATRIEFE